MSESMHMVVESVPLALRGRRERPSVWPSRRFVRYPGISDELPLVIDSKFKLRNEHYANRLQTICGGPLVHVADDDLKIPTLAYSGSRHPVSRYDY